VVISNWPSRFFVFSFTNFIFTSIQAVYRVALNFLREFNFADWRFFVFCGNYFLRLEKIGFSCWELIFAIFWKSRSNRNDNDFHFV